MHKIKIIAENCTSCGLCVKECSFLRINGTPGEISRAFLTGLSDNFDSIFHCNLCGLCQAVCPQNLGCQTAFLEIRKIIQNRLAQKGNSRSTLPEHSTICRYEAIGSSSLFSLYLIPDKAKSVFFPGCTLAATRSTVTRKTYKYLQTIAPNMGIVLDCCSKPSHDIGLNSHFLQSMKKLTSRLIRHNVDTLVTACPSCYTTFAKYAPGLKTMTVYEMLAQHPPPFTIKHSTTISIHDTCTSRYNSEIQESVRTLVKSTGARLEEMKHSRSRAICCGEGASSAYLAPDFKNKWTDLRKKEANGHRVITYCAGCSSSLAKTVSTTHLLDLLFDSEKALQHREKVTRSPFTYISRLLLKKKLKKSVTAANGLKK